MTTEKNTFSEYLSNTEAIERDLAFSNVNKDDWSAVELSAAEVLADRPLANNLEKLASGIMLSNEEWNRLYGDCVPPELQGRERTAIPSKLAFALLLPLLYNVESLRDLYAKRNIPEAFLVETLSDIGRWIDTYYERSGNKVRAFSNIAWLREHFSMRLFHIGRLQFQMSSMADGYHFIRNIKSGERRLVSKDEFAKYDATEWTEIVKAGEPVINVHIPSGSKLDTVQCRQSIEAAPQFFKKFFADMPVSKAKAFVCGTWLFYKDFEDILPETSNIRAFMGLFTCGCPHGGDESFYERVFVPNGRDTKREELTSSLQRALFDHIAKGNLPSCRMGMIEIEPPKPLRIGVLGSGSGSNMQSIQDAIERGELNAEIVTVIADVPGAGILARAAKHNLPNQYMDPAPFKTKLEGRAEDEVIRVLKEAGVDVVVLAGYMRVVKPKLLAAFPNRVLNIHPAILPSFPGIAGWKQALDYGAKVAGCTVHFVNAGIDSGPIIVQKVVPVMDDDTPATLHARIQIEEHKAYPEAIDYLAKRELIVVGRRVFIMHLNSQHSTLNTTQHSCERKEQR